MTSITKALFFLTILVIGVFGITLSLPSDDYPSDLGLFISAILILVGIVGLMHSVINTFLSRKRL